MNKNATAHPQSLPGYYGCPQDNKSPRKFLLRPDTLNIAFDLLVAWDVLTIAGTGYACAVVYDLLQGASFASSGSGVDAGPIANVAALLAPFVLQDKRWRVASKTVSVNDLLASIAQRFAVLTSLLLAAGFLTHIVVTVPRIWVVMWVTSSFMGTLGGRLLLMHFVRAAIVRETVCDRVVVVGGGPIADRLLGHLHGPGAAGVRLVAVFDTILGPCAAAADRSLAELIDMGRRGLFDRVILAPTETNDASVFEIVYRLKALDVEVCHYSSLFGPINAARPISEVAGVPLVVLNSRPFNRWGVVFKQIEDRLLALLALIAAAPALAVIALAVRLDSPGPIIFRQRRHGWNGSEFEILKFRTMTWHDRPEAGNGEVQTRRADSRITRVGSFLRKTSLDELPQLFNVLNGTMSMVGPRPHPVFMRTEQRLGEEIVAEYLHRHRVKPGITGWAQVNGLRGATETAEQIRKRVEFDIYYIDNWSPLLDLKILALTPLQVLVHRTNAY